MSYAERLKPGFARASSSWRSAALSPPGASSPPAFHGSDTLRFRWRPSGAVRAAMSHPGACTSPYHAHLAGRGGHGEIARSSVNILLECWCCSLSSRAPPWQVPKRRPISTRRIMPRRLQLGITPRHLRGTATTIRGPGIPGTATIKEVLASERSLADRFDSSVGRWRMTRAAGFQPVAP